MYLELLTHHYSEKNYEKIWYSAKESVNQLGRDLSRPVAEQRTSTETRTSTDTSAQGDMFN